MNVDAALLRQVERMSMVGDFAAPDRCFVVGEDADGESLGLWEFTDEDDAFEFIDAWREVNSASQEVSG